MMRALLLAGVVAAAGVFASAQAWATVLISNYPQANDDTRSTLAGQPNLSKAAGFTMAADASYRLDSVTMRLSVTNVARTIFVALYGGSAANPSGPALDGFVIPAFTTTGTADYTFLAASTFTLAAQETYWIVASANDSGGPNEIAWLASSPGITPTGLATSDGYRFSSSGAIPPTVLSTTSNTYSVQGTLVPTPVPEPASLALLGMGVAGIVAARRRQTG